VKRLCVACLFLAILPFRLALLTLLNVVATGKHPRKIIVIHLAGLGDLLMLTPTLAALKRRFPEAKIELITLHEYVKQAFEHHPHLDSITTLPAHPGQLLISKFTKRSGAGLFFTVISYYSPLLLKYLFSRHEVGINFGLSDSDRNLGAALLFCLGVPKRIGLSGASEKLLTDRVSVEYERAHRVDAYLGLVKPLGVLSANPEFEFPVRDVDLRRVKLALLRENINPSTALAVINPGGKLHINSRRWPAEYYARVCHFLSLEAGFQIVLMGDEDDREVCNEIAQGQIPRVKSMAGMLSFSETAALLSLSHLCITNDTSILHLAEAVRVPKVISIFGPTNPDLLAPRNERHVVFRSHLDCAPCMGGLIDANTKRCWRDVKEECLLQTPPEQVVATLSDFYARRASRVASA
jgi:ADP-heptose:LPS heptosyltransferase